MKKTILKFSYITSRNYFVWIAANCLVFLPATMFVLMLNALDIGIRAAADYLIAHNFKLSFSYQTYASVNVKIAKAVKHDRN